MHWRLSTQEFDLALNAAARYHNQISYNAPARHDEAETEQIEERVRLHMEAPSSDEEDYVTSEEDLVYEDQFYI